MHAWAGALLALTLVTLPQLFAAHPYIITGPDPADPYGYYEWQLPEGEVGHEASPPGQAEPAVPLQRLMQLFEDDDNFKYQRKRSGLRAALVARRGRELRAAHAPDLDEGLGSVARRSGPGETPHLGVAILSNVGQYFNGLRNELETITDQKPIDPMLVDSPSFPPQVYFHGMLREGPRPAATAAYLHAVRQRPSHRVRSFVSDPGPLELQGANSHDPALLWTGLGR